MKELDLSRLYSASLKYKILFGFLFSMLPVVIIVMVTYFPAKESALVSSHNQVKLIGAGGGEKLNAFFRTGANTFLEWTKEDVYGMAIEFNAMDELKKHLLSIQTHHPEFNLILLTDNNGVILEESRSSHIQHADQKNLAGNSIKEIRPILSGPDRGVFLVNNNPTEKSGSQPLAHLLYSFRTADSSGQPNGYFLVYLEITELMNNVESILAKMQNSGFMTSRVVVLNTLTKRAVGNYGGPLFGADGLLDSSLQAALLQQASGEINTFSTEHGNEHFVSIPLDVNQSLSKTGTSTGDELQLSLLISLAEREIMSKVMKTLVISVIIGGIGVLAILFIGLFTVRSVIRPIGNLVDVLQRYGAGDASVRAQVTSRDEIGYFTEEFNAMLEQINSSGTALQESEAHYRNLFENLQNAVNNKNYAYRFTERAGGDELAISLNGMLDTLDIADTRAKREDWLKTGLTQLSEKISGEHKLDDLCRRAITFIAGYTGVQVGTLFTVHCNDDDRYDLIASYAFRKRKGIANRYKKGEGLIGQAALEKKVIHFTEIPEDYISIESSLGTATPSNILVVPLIYEGNVKGIIELGASFNFTQRYTDFCDQVSRVVAVAINAAIANDKLKELLDQTRQQSETLRSQQEELQTANEELEHQTEVLKDSEARLQVQQEELQASNEEMEEKNEMLEEQKKENEEKNRNLQEKQYEIEQKAKELEIATKYKSEFLSNMSHELRTPLNSMLLLAKMLSDNEEETLTEDQMESAASIHRSGQNLLHLINAILDLSKIEAGRVELSVTGTTPNTITSNFEMEFKHLAKDKGLEFITELEDGLPDTLVTDVHRLDQIIRNLLGNAFKFTDTGSVTLRIARPSPDNRITRDDLDSKDAISISVTDTGPGIPDDKLNLIFEAFKQVDGSISRRHGGTGLGLSISRELANLIGGELSATSTLDIGTVFTLFIPKTFVSSDASEHIPKQEISPPVVKQQHPTSLTNNTTGTVEKTLPILEEGELSKPAKSMLIIEDDDEFSSILASFFKKSGYESIVASTGEIGIKYAIEHKPTAMILDIGLPGIDGWTVLKELKNNPDTRHIPVHIMSAYDQRSEGLKKGAVGYLTKPVSIDGLKSALGKIEYVLENDVKELLVVEDDKQLRNNILKLMGTHDIHATAAETGSQAMDLLRENRFDCMILDLGLPDISGFALLDEIEKDTSIAKLPVIIYTGRDLTQDETDRLEKYSSSIVLKSAFSMERLLDETTLFMHRIEQDMPESQRKMIQEVREKDSSIKGKNLLLVDDDMRNAFALNKFLKSKGVNVTIANNGKKALETLATERKPDIVLMDIMMPVMDGYEAMKEIRKINELKDLPILALTAKAMETDREECLRCGANDYLSKPIDTTKLLSMLRIWMY